MCVSPQPRAIFRQQNCKKRSRNEVFCTFSLQNVPFATAACIFSTSELPKVLSEWGVLYIFTSECIFRHRGVHFFNIRTYKSGPNTSCFVHFHFRMFFFATGVCIFSTSELTKVVQTRHVLYIFTSECAFRHSGVQFFICLLSTYLRTRRFNRPTFRLT